MSAHVAPAYPPGPHGWRLFRLLWAHRCDPLPFLVALGNEYGDLVHFRLGPRHVLLVKDPGLIREVLVLKQANFAKGLGHEWAKRFLGQGLLTSDGELNTQRRKLMQPAFHRSRLEGYASAMVAHSEAISRGWRDGEVVEMAGVMRQLALSIVAKTLFGAEIDAEAAVIDQALSSIIGEFRHFYRAGLPFADLLDRLPLPSNVRFDRAVSSLEETVTGLIQARRRSGEVHDDLLSMLMSAQEPNEAGACPALTDGDIRDEVMTLLLAGHETTANALTWTWYLLSEHEAVEYRLHRELSAVLSGRPPTFDDVARLPYTQAVLAETLRLFPPAFGLGRRAVAPTVIGGVPIGRGSLVIVSPYVTHRDPRWFPDPDRFEPERWLPDRQAAPPEFAYFPFGGGPRRCVAEHFAWMEGVLVIATLAQRWKFRLVSGHPVRPQGLVTLRPKYGMPMHVIPS